MLKRAAILFAFSVILSSCVFKDTLHSATPLSPPDLRMTHLYVNIQGKLTLTITNIGNSPLPLRKGKLKIFIDGSLAKTYSVKRLTDQTFLPARKSLTFTTPFVLSERHEVMVQIEFPSTVKEYNAQNNCLKKKIGGLPAGPDIVVKDLVLTDDLELTVLLANIGDVDLPPEVTFQIKVWINGGLISEFEHFAQSEMKANIEKQYAISPPNKIIITGISNVKVSISSKLPEGQTPLRQNDFEETFIIFPLSICSQGKQEYTFSFFPDPDVQKEENKKMRAEARWEVSSTPLMLSFHQEGSSMEFPILSGESPLQIELPVHIDDKEKESIWKIIVTGLSEKKADGFLIITYPGGILLKE